MNIEKIIVEPQNPEEPDTAKELRVAAYCRVSTDNEEQRTSFANQVRSYTDIMISSRGKLKRKRQVKGKEEIRNEDYKNPQNQRSA